MIFYVPEVKMDGNTRVAEIKVNLQPTRRQARTIFTVKRETADSRVDIVINRWSTPTIKKMSTVSIEIEGTDMSSSKSFAFDLGYNFISKKWLVNGHVGSNNVDESLNRFGDLFILITKLF